MDLSKYEYLISSNSNSPSNTWMFRGYEDKVNLSVKLENEFRYLNKKSYLKKINRIGLPNKIRHLAFHNLYNYAFFSTPDNPRALYSLYIPDPLSGNIPDKNKFLYKISNLKEYEKTPILELIEDIVSICIVDEYIFILTVSKSRTRASDTWKVYRMMLVRDKGLVDGYRVATTIEYSNDIEINYDNISFIVIKSGNNKYTMYVSSESFNNIYYCDLIPGNKISLNILLNDKIYALKNYKLSTYNFEIKSGSIIFLAASQNALYKVICYESNKFKSISLLHVFNNEILSISHADINANYLPYKTESSKRINIGYQILSFMLVAIAIDSIKNLESKTSKVLTVSQYNLQILPLVGGGPISVGNADSNNLLDYDIGIIDTIISLNNHFLVFGKKDSDNWFILLLPQMYTWLEKGTINYSNGDSEKSPEIKDFSS